MQNSLVLIENLNDIEKLKEMGIENFLYPLEFFSVGFKNYFKLEEIKEENAYLYVNCIFTSEELDNLKIILENLPSNIKGIVFDDLGIVEITKDINIKKILFNNHISASLPSITSYLKYVDTVVITPDLTIEEVNNILRKSSKKLCIYGYGHLNISYSRRKLNTTYSEFHKLKKEKIINICNTDYNFFTVENDKGTIIYDKNIYNGLNEKYEDNIDLVIINLSNTSLEKFIENKNNNNTSTGFLHKKTIYKLKGGKL